MALYLTQGIVLYTCGSVSIYLTVPLHLTKLYSVKWQECGMYR